MKRTDLDACMALVRAVVAELPSAARDRDSLDAANLRRRCGEIHAGSKLLIQRAQAASAIADLFALAETAGGDLAAFGEFRRFVVALASRAGVATDLRYAIIRMALASECRAATRAAFRSRADAEELQDTLNAAFDAQCDAAAAETGPESWRALTALQAAISDHLAQAARLLPRIVPYATEGRKPSLWLAQRLFADGARADELADENRAVHPLFMPAAGVALSQ